MKKYILALLICICVSGVSFAEIVKGVVMEPNGEPAIGATVLEKGKPSNGTSTNIDGEFSLNVASLKSSSLEVSYIGMENKVVKIDGKNNLLIELKYAGGFALDEVVIVGYGTQKKINATGAVKTIDNAVLESRPLSNAVQGLQGAVAGLNITNDAGGGLGQKMNINIRGMGSIGDGSDASPLVLIDGMEGDLSNINPNDIENISVLKDAASASIFGSRAPFGVIIITTKTGTQGTRVNYSGSVRAAQPINLPHMASGLEYAYMMNDAYANCGSSGPYNSTELDKIALAAQGLYPKVVAMPWDPSHWGKDQSNMYDSTDWYDVHVKDVVWSQEHNLSVSGANEKTNYYFSGNLLDQNGLFKYADENYRRMTLAGKVNITFNKYVKFLWSSRIVATRNKKPSALNGLFYHNLGRICPLAPVTMPEDSPAAGEYHYQSLIPSLQDGGDQITKEQVFYNQGTLLINPLEDWTIHLEVNSRIEHNPFTRQFKPVYQTLPTGATEGIEVLPIGSNQGQHKIASNGTFDVNPAAGENYYEVGETSINYFSTNLYTDYLWKLGKNEFKFMVGMQTEQYSQRLIRNASWDIQMADRPWLPGTVGSEEAMVYESKGEWSNLGFFGRINYNYDNRYMLEFNLRADGASRFPEDKRWGWFTSASAGWNVAQEKFWEPLVDYWNYFKIRVSYGEQGNQNTQNFYPYIRQMQTNGGNVVIGDKQATVLPIYAPVTNDITWERIENANAGVDLGFFNNRLTGTFEVYQRMTKDMIGPAQSLPGVFGASAPRTNNAELRTRGWELELGWQDRINKDWSYSITGTLSDYKTVITKYASPDNKYSGWYAGRDYGEIWGYRVVGIAKSDAEMDAYVAKHDMSNMGDGVAIRGRLGGGDIMYADLNNDGSVNNGAQTIDDPGDMTKIGNNTPRFAYGLTLTAQWRWIDFRAFFQGIGKRDFLFSGSAPFYGIASEWQRTFYKDHLDYFRYAGSELGANPDAYYARPRVDGFNTKDSDYFLQDASYFRLKNIQIGFSLPEYTKLAKYVKKARLYVSGENLFTHTNLRIFDPEAVTGDWGAGKAYPNYRTWSVGLEVTF